MKTIPYFRAAHLVPYLKFLQGLGASVEKSLRRSKLPSGIIQESPGHLPLLPTLRFLINMAHREGIDNLTLRSREQTQVQELSPSLARSVYSAPTLKTAIKQAVRLATRENSQLDIWMIPEENGVRVCHRHRVPFQNETSQYLELHTTLWLLAVIRVFAGSNWCPDEISFRSTIPIDPFANNCFPNTHFFTGQEMTWIRIPRVMLSWPSKEIQLPEGIPSSCKKLHSETFDQEQTFPSSLKRILPLYLSDGYPNIHLAAEIAGMSVRTFQRTLNQSGLRYTELIQHLRIEMAQDLLKNPDLKVIDVAYAVGYEDPSNFARAYRAVAGTSPREFRKQFDID